MTEEPKHCIHTLWRCAPVAWCHVRDSSPPESDQEWVVSRKLVDVPASIANQNMPGNDFDLVGSSLLDVVPAEERIRLRHPRHLALRQGFDKTNSLWSRLKKKAGLRGRLSVEEFVLNVLAEPSLRWHDQLPYDPSAFCWSSLTEYQPSDFEFSFEIEKEGFDPEMILHELVCFCVHYAALRIGPTLQYLEENPGVSARVYYGWEPSIIEVVDSSVTPARTVRYATTIEDGMSFAEFFLLAERICPGCLSPVRVSERRRDPETRAFEVDLFNSQQARQGDTTA